MLSYPGIHVVPPPGDQRVRALPVLHSRTKDDAEGAAVQDAPGGANLRDKGH